MVGPRFRESALSRHSCARSRNLGSTLWPNFVFGQQIIRYISISLLQAEVAPLIGFTHGVKEAKLHWVTEETEDQMDWPFFN